MAEITLQQIAELLAAQETRIVTGLEARMDQKLAAQETRIVAGLEARMDQKLAAQEARIVASNTAQITDLEARMDKKLAETLEGVKETVRTVVLSVGEQLNAMKEEIVREVGALHENREGKQIKVLFEESHSHKARLADHEERIVNLEAAGS